MYDSLSGRTDIKYPLSDKRLKEAVGRIEDVLMASLDWRVLIQVLADEVLRAGIFRSLTIALVNWEDGYAEIVGNYLAVDRSGKINPDLSKGAIYVEESDKADPFLERLDGLRIALADTDDFTVRAALSGGVVTQGFIEEPGVSRKVKIGYFIPLRCGGRVAAVLSTGSQPEGQEEMIRRIELMQPLFKQVALALEHARIHRALERRHQVLQQRDRLVAALQQVEHSLLSSLDRDEILDSLVREVVAAGFFSSLMVAVVDARRGCIDVVRSVLSTLKNGEYVAENVTKVLGLSYDIGDANITAEVARSGEMAVLDEWDPRYDKRIDSPSARQGRTSFFIPIKKGSEVVAVLATGCPTGEKEGVLDRITMLQPLFDMLALALEHAALYAALSEQRQRLAITLENIGDGVVATDRMGTIVSSNDRFGRLTAVDDGGVGLPLLDVLQVDEDGHRSLVGLVDGVLSDGQRATTELVHGGGEESRRRWRLDGASIRTEDGLVDGAVFVVRDITAERAREEEQLRVERIESLGQLAGGIAHDFNNMLSSISVNTSLLKMGLDEGQRGAIADDMEKALLRARDLTDQLMVFMRKRELVRKRAALPEIVREASVFALRGSNIQLTVDAETDLWSVDVDANQIAQVVHNLILNAQQAMPNGGTISVVMRNIESDEKTERLLHKGSYVMCSVCDTGMGIKREDINHIFDPYFTTKGDGNGLGLSSSYAIVNRHGGVLTADSNVGEGAEFRFYLPKGTGSSGVERASADYAGVSARSARVLLLDDDEQLCAAVMRAHEELGYSISATTSEEQLLLRYQSAWSAGSPFDVAILDMTIPGGKGGIDMARKIQQINPQARIVLSTGYVQSPDMANFRALGFVACLNKPYTVSEFRNAVEQALAA